MKKILKGIVCLGIMCWALEALCYETKEFTEYVGDYKVKVTRGLVEDGAFAYDYSISVYIYQGDERVNYCVGRYTCMFCPYTNSDWLNTLKNQELACVDSYPTLLDIVTDD